MFGDENLADDLNIGCRDGNGAVVGWGGFKLMRGRCGLNLYGVSNIF